MARLLTSKSRVLHRDLSADMPLVDKAHGHYIYTGGKRLFDLSGGPCVASIGHSHPRLVDAMYEQAERASYIYSGLFANEPAERLADRLAGYFPNEWFGRAGFVGSGNEAVDLSLRIAAQYHAERGDPRRIVAAREFGYHGLTLLTAAISGEFERFPMMRDYTFPMRSNYVVKLPAFGYQFSNEEQALASARQWCRLAAKTDKKISAIIFEPIGGPPVGIYTPTREYLRGMRALADEFGALLIFDEIISGAGRCGHMSAATKYDVMPDILILGKGLTSGHLPLSAILVSQKVLEAFESGTVMTGTTYFNHPMACACANAFLEVLEYGDLMGRMSLGAGLSAQCAFELAEIRNGVSIAYHSRGVGALWGLELRHPSGRHFAPSDEVHKVARRAIMDQGVICYSKGGTMGGFGDFLIFAPPYTATALELESSFKKVKTALKGLENVFEA